LLGATIAKGKKKRGTEEAKTFEGGGVIALQNGRETLLSPNEKKTRT